MGEDWRLIKILTNCNKNNWIEIPRCLSSALSHCCYSLLSSSSLGINSFFMWTSGQLWEDQLERKWETKVNIYEKRSENFHEIRSHYYCWLGTVKFWDLWTLYKGRVLSLTISTVLYTVINKCPSVILELLSFLLLHIVVISLGSSLQPPVCTAPAFIQNLRLWLMPYSSFRLTYIMAADDIHK